MRVTGFSHTEMHYVDDAGKARSTRMPAEFSPPLDAIDLRVGEPVDEDTSVLVWSVMEGDNAVDDLRIFTSAEVLQAVTDGLNVPPPVITVHMAQFRSQMVSEGYADVEVAIATALDDMGVSSIDKATLIERLRGGTVMSSNDPNVIAVATQLDIDVQDFFQAARQIQL